jgi:hypothetical protein
MSSRWHYRIHGRDVGPVDFSTLQVMAQEERLFVDDEIRPEESDQWVAAETVAGLFPESADADDLQSMLAEADTLRAHEDRENWRDACFCRTRSEELGPMSFDKLIGLARTGRLARRDQVRLGTQGEWIEARSVDGLFADPKRSTIERRRCWRHIEIVSDPTPQKLRAPRLAPEPVLQMEDEFVDPGDDVNVVAAADIDVPDVDAQWHCRVLGQEMGPVSWSDMRELAESRQLGPNDRVRKGRSVAWVPAGTISGLFVKRAKKKSKKGLSEDDVFGYLQPKEEEEPTTSHMAPQRSFEPLSRKSSSEMTARPAAAGGAPKPAAGAVPSSPPATPVTAMPAPRPAFTPPPPPPRPRREKRRMGNPFSGVGSSLGSMGGSLPWKPIGAVAVVLLVVAGVYAVGIPGLGGSSGKSQYAETKVMWEEAQKIRQSESAADWAKFKTATLPRVKELSVELDPIATADRRLAQLMLFCHRDCLPVLLAGTVHENQAIWKEMEGYMKEAEGLANK